MRDLSKTLIISFLTICTLSFIACSNQSSKKGAATKPPEMVTPTNTTTATNTNTDTSTGTTTDITNLNGTRPKILVVGWGPTDCQPFVDWMVEDGFPKEHAYLFKYSYMKDPETVKGELAEQFRQVFAKYPEDVKFDVIGLSTGHFTSIYTIMEEGFDTRIARIIGAVGIAHGINSVGLDYRTPSIVYSYDDPGYSLIVGKTIAALSPYMNPFLTSFYQKYDARIKNIRKCSIFSPQDSLIAPYDTGKFDDGENYSVPGIKHISGLDDRDSLYTHVVENCFKGSWFNQ